MTRSPTPQQPAGFFSLLSVRETVFIPQKVADPLKDYLKEKSFKPDDRISPVGYEAVRAIVRKAGNAVGIKLSPTDLKRHAATRASRSGVPVEMVSKVIPRHTNLSATQRYHGKLTDSETIRWIDNFTPESGEGEAREASPGFLCYREDMQVLLTEVAFEPEQLCAPRHGCTAQREIQMKDNRGKLD